MGDGVMGREKNSQQQPLLQFILLVAFFFPVSWADQWTVSGPQHISALKHSCLVIPCTFDYPKDVDETQRKMIWYRGEDVAFDSSNPDEASRTSLVGSHGSKNCSLLIRNVNEADTGDAKQWMFRVEFDTYNRYSFNNHKVVINLELNPPNPELYGYKDEMTEGETVTLQCNTAHTCNVHPPAITWSPEYGRISVEHKDLKEGKWEVTSRHTFTAFHHHHGRRVTCSVRYVSGMESKMEKTPQFKVLYRPEISSDSICQFTLTQFECWCVVKSNPPAAITWQFPDRNVSFAEKNINSDPFLNGYVTKSRHKGTGRLPSSITCSASNKEGTTHLLLPNQMDGTTLTNVVAVPAVLIVIALALSCAVYHYRRTRTSQQREPNKNSVTQAKQFEVEEPELELESASSCDYENEFFVEQPKLMWSHKSQEVLYSGGLCKMDSESCDENLYQNC